MSVKLQVLCTQLPIISLSDYFIPAKPFESGQYLDIYGITRDQAGEYECSAENDVSVPDVKKVKVTVNCKLYWFLITKSNGEEGCGEKKMQRAAVMQTTAARGEIVVCLSFVLQHQNDLCCLMFELVWPKEVKTRLRFKFSFVCWRVVTGFTAADLAGLQCWDSVFEVMS